LSAAYTAARDAPATDHGDAIRLARTELRDLLVRSATNHYPPSRRKILQTIGGELFVGNPANLHVDMIIFDASISAASALTAIQTFVTLLNQFRGTCAQARKGLTGLQIKPDQLVDDQAEVGVLVPWSLTHGHLESLNRQLREWNFVLRGLAELAGEGDREVRVRGLATGSDQVFLEASLTVAGLVALVIDKVLGWFKTIQEIQKARKELERLGVPPIETEAAKAHEKKFVKDEITGLVNQLIDKAPPLPANRRGEMRTHLTVSIEYVTRFVDQGGDVEVSVPPPPPPPEFVPPPEPPLTDAELDEKRAEAVALHNASREVQERALIARQGAALAELSERPVGILQLPESTPPSETSDGSESGDGKKPPKKK
jgi:hypothetical protein